MAIWTPTMEARFSAKLQPGETLARYIDTSIGDGCGCVTHQEQGIDVAVCARSKGEGKRHRYRCLTCDRSWLGMESRQ